VALMVAGLALVIALISWLMTHPEAGRHHAGQVNVGSRCWISPILLCQELYQMNLELDAYRRVSETSPVLVSTRTNTSRFVLR
jgi:hypothetical protein